jgi:hypothetical protein
MRLSKLWSRLFGKWFPTKENPKHWQIRIMESVEKILAGVIHHASGVREFSTMTLPDGDIAQVRIFHSDFFGSITETVMNGEIFRVEVKYPDHFVLIVFAGKHKVEYCCETPQSLGLRAKERLEDFLSEYYSSPQRLSHSNLFSSD